MNSSGIKRGLATTAVSALAIAGLPLFASAPASADPGDTIRVVSQSPVLSGGTLGGIFRLQVSETVDPNLIELSNTSFNNIPSNGDQEVVEVEITAATDSNPDDDFDEYLLDVSITTNAPGDSFSFGIFENSNGSDTVGDGSGRPTFTAGEPRTTVSGTTAGEVDRVVVSPTLQSAPVDTDSGNYTVTLVDSEGRRTQLNDGETVSIDQGESGSGTLETSTDSLTALQMQDGSQTFTAQANEPDLYSIDLVATNGAEGSASLDVNGEVATGIAQTEVDVVTGADNRAGFGKMTDEVLVRPDQSSITFNIKSPDNAGNVVIFEADSLDDDVTFDGAKDTVARTTTLNGNGVGSITIPVDAASIQNGDEFVVSGGGFEMTVIYSAPTVADAGVTTDSQVYLTAFKGTTSPTVTVKDQYGNPATSTFVTYRIVSGPNAGAESARQAVDANGKVTFNITDTKATNVLNQDDLVFTVYAGQFGDALAENDDAIIRYSADGTGADFLVTVDSQTPGGAAYNPVIQPLTDTDVDGDQTVGSDDEDSADEFATVRIAGGTDGASATVTADNGGLVLLEDETTLADAAASKTATVDDEFFVVGTQAGTVNLTITSGGKTRTATVTVRTLSESTSTIAGDQGADDLAQAPETARNIAVAGPEAVVAGDVVEFVATITDAFGNPVRGFDSDDVNAVLTGPAEIQGVTSASNAAGEITYTVELNQDARNPITLRVTGEGADFGAAADRLTDDSATDDGEGLTASVATASATATVTNLADLEEAVARAEAELAAAEADLAAAQANLDVAQAQLAVAQANVDTLQAKKQKLRQKLNKAKANGNRQKAKTTRNKLRNVKRNLRAAKDAVVIAQTRVDGEQTVVDLRQDQVDAAAEALAAAQADLEEAQN